MGDSSSHNSALQDSSYLGNEKDSRVKRKMEDEGFRVLRSEKLQVGQAVMMYWFDPKEAPKSAKPSNFVSFLDRIDLIGNVRQVVIIDERNGYSMGLPIDTHKKGGTSAPEFHPEDHALIYIPPRPRPPPQEPRQPNPPIEVDPAP